MSDYTIQKEGSHWIVTGLKGFRRLCKTKKEALAYAEEHNAEAAWNTRLLALDSSGVYDWNEDDLIQIDKLASALRNKETRQYGGEAIPIEDRSRQEQDRDAKIIAQWERYRPISEHGLLVCAECRMRRAARIEAFRRAGLVL